MERWVRISPRLPTTAAEFQVFAREFNAFVADLPADDAEWQAVTRLLGIQDRVVAKLPLTDAEWQAGVLRNL